MRLKRNNVERVTESVSQIAKLKRDGFKEVTEEVIETEVTEDTSEEIDLSSIVIRQIKCCLIPQIKNDFLRYVEVL